MPTPLWQTMALCLVGGAFSALAAVESSWAVPEPGELVVDPRSCALLMLFCGVGCLPMGALLVGRRFQTTTILIGGIRVARCLVDPHVSASSGECA
ncbi:MAG: hypothetical protein ACYS1B_08290 [Planctomycetota bacterium]|jgi:hypothetical protein